MPMTQLDFTQLCRDTASYLALTDPNAMGSGETFFVDEVSCEMGFSEGKASAFLTCEVGDPEPHFQAEVYRELLEIQMLFVGNIDAMFARDPINDRLLFVARMPVHPDVSSEKLAHAIKQLTQQVRDWQSKVLAGKLIDYGAEFDRRFPPEGAQGTFMGSSA